MSKMMNLGLFYSVFALAIGTTLFGYSIAEMNAPQESIQSDLNLTDAQIGLASAIFALGGLLGALLASQMIQGLGPRKSVVVTSLLYAAGAILKVVSWDITLLVLGRILSGVAAGAVTVCVPLFINDLAPPGAKGRFGATTQITINVGILLTQILGNYLNQTRNWRYVMAVGGALGIAQAVMLVGVTESPQTLYKDGKKELARKVLVALRGTDDVEDEYASFGRSESANNEESSEIEPLISNVSPSSIIGLRDFISKSEYRSSFFLVMTIMLVQQFTGVNAVVMYGVSILSGLLPQWAGSINAAISGVNLIITITASLLFDRINHRTLLLTSIAGMSTFSAVLALGIKYEQPILSVVGIFLFVSSFSIGLGPLPWMIASKNVAAQATSSAQSIALVANWSGTGIIGLFVPIIASALGMPTLFFIFTGIGCASFIWGVSFLP